MLCVAPVYDGTRRGERRMRRSMDVEIRIAELRIPVGAVQFFPDNPLLFTVALVRYQEVQRAVKFEHSREMVVAKEAAHLSFIQMLVKLNKPIESELTRSLG